MSRDHAAVSLVLTFLVLGGAACTSDSPDGTEVSPARGGVYRTAVESLGFIDGLDPTGEYNNRSFALYGQLLLRTLVTYDHVAGLPGDRLVPDLATDTGQVSADGLTWTFHLKEDVRFGPPVNRAITSMDIAYAFRRIDTKAFVAQYGFYYDGTIVGMNGPTESMPSHIAGIDTPDGRTIVFHLRAPTGDFGYRLALPATAPIPVEVASCFTKAGDYGRNLVSSGPYMIRGADQVDASSCSTIKPMSGFDPTSKLILVRNPNYAPQTDSPADRESNIDGLSLTVDASADDIFNRIQTGDLDGSFNTPPPATVQQRYLSNPELKQLLHVNAADGISYISMNILVPPFDDLHVRRAVNFVLDKAAVQKAAGGPIQGGIATHIFPPTVVDAGSSNLDPYASRNGAGDLERAKGEMKLSAYDHDKDGRCDDAACNNVLMISTTAAPWPNMAPIIVAALASIGIPVRLSELDAPAAYQSIQTVKNLVPLASFPGWLKDYPDPSTFAVVFESSAINCEGQINYSEVGMTRAQAERCGVLPQWQAVGGQTLSVDRRIADCEGLIGQSRDGCWVALDSYLMEDVVPWVPLTWANAVDVMSKSVTRFEFDQSTGVIALCHLAVNNGLSSESLN